MRRTIVIIAALFLGCGTVQHGVEPAQLVPTKGLPSKPFPNQLRPGADGKCENPRFVVLNGGCWARMAIDLDTCEESGEKTYLRVYKGACYYPVLDFVQREPTSSLERWRPAHVEPT